jgi:PAS domain S-box-containing protein
MSSEDAVGRGALPVDGARQDPAEDTQRRRERQARVILESMYQFVALLDARGHILEVNRPALEGVGYTLEEVLGRPLWEVECWQVTPETPEQLRREVLRTAREGFARFEMEMFGARAGQEVVTLDISLKTLLDEQGRVAYILGEGRNITEKKVAEAEVARQNEELRILYERLRDFDRLKTQFFANVSHELRTPLALILGPVRRRLQAGGLGDEGRRDLEVVERNARTLLKHVNDLLDLSKLEAGQMQVHRAGVDLARLSRFVASHFDVLAEERAIRFTVETPEALPGRVDRRKIQRVLLNLLSNAFKFTPEGGAVRLRLQREGDQAVFVVEDSGPGVPPEHREVVFERFRQVEGGTTRQHGGTGLGLAIVKEFVILHGGTVRADEAPGGGAAFVVTIPKEAPAEDRHDHAGAGDAEVACDPDLGRQAVEELRTHRPGRVPADDDAGSEAPLVLVVEDHSEMNAFVAETLANGHRVACAFDGREGLEKAISLRPDLIVSDVMMPGMGGDELVRAVRCRRELDGIPILLLTAKADEELRVRLLNEGAQDYLDKPFVAEELRARADRLIGERRRAAEALRQRDALLRTVVEGVPDTVFLKDQRGRYVMINSAGAGILGRSVAEVVGKDDRELFDPETAHQFAVDDARVMAAGEPLSFENQLTLASSTRTFHTTKAPYCDHDGQVVGVIGIARDITERKRAEEELRAAKDAAEAADRAKSQFLAVLSHELRTPLTPVLATVSYVEAMPDLPAELREEIAAIRRNVETEARLIDDLLDLTRISRGGLRLQREPIDAHAVLRAALEVCQPDIEDKELDLTLGLRAREHHVWADPGRLQQVFWNLIKNAVKFTPPEGRVMLRSSNGDAGRRLTIEVSDTGIGIEPDFLPWVFDPFEQAERSGPRRYGGLGLGLAIAQSLVDQHGGTLTAASEGPGRGARFTLELETVPPPAEAPAPPAATRPRAGRALKILFVEDNPDTLRSLTRLLQSSGFLVEPAASVRAALEAAARERFDLLISDIGLPDGSGLEVARQVRGRYGVRGIAFSGFGSAEDKRASLEAGFEHHLVKPVNFATLAGVIQDMVGPA